MNFVSKIKRIFGNLKNFSTTNLRSCKNNKQVDVTIKYEKMKVLNVAEKNDAAKNIANLLSQGRSQRREGLSQYNKIYEFNFNLWNQNCQMVMTSVSGHLLTHEFSQSHRAWHSCHPSSLFDAPVFKICPNPDIKKTIEREVRSADTLIIWTDCDREGENIGFEVIEVCKAIKPNIQIYRAIFSEITSTSVRRAVNSLVEPNKRLSDAVDVRSELDLRIGAAFTRFQTLRLQRAFPQNLSELLISYGSCQFPTLGFVVERYLAIERFISEPYWKIKVTDVRDEISVEFRWARNRLFEKLPCEVFLDMCQDNPEAEVKDVICKPKSKWRPLPLDTVELEKQGSRKLKLTAKETMKIAEKLYSQGFISYPRTETNIFPKELNLTPIVTDQTQHAVWGDFASRVLNDGISPRQGKKSDQAHPPIHPIKFTNSLQGNEARVYEFVVRHFLACVSKNAEGYETIVNIDIAGEKFTANGLQIIARNYLEVYIYEKWSDKEMHTYQMGDKFQPTEIAMVEEHTSAPNLLTEADLIALMDKHGIGTDATHAEHIDTIKQRHYIGMQNDNKHIIPGKLGIGLVMGYDSMGFPMSKPHLRAELENDLKMICEGRKEPREVLQQQIDKYREVFNLATEKANLLDTSLTQYLGETPANVPQLPFSTTQNPTVFKCPKCGSDMHVRTKRDGNTFFIGCSRFPDCKNSIWFQDYIENIEVTNDSCQHCENFIKIIQIKFKQIVNPQFGKTYKTCLSCDSIFREFLGIDIRQIIPNSSSNSGFVSVLNSRPTVPSTNQRPRSTSSSRGTNSRTTTSRGTGSRSTSSSRPSSNQAQSSRSTGSSRSNNQGSNVASTSGNNNRNMTLPNRTNNQMNTENAQPANWERHLEMNDTDVIVCQCNQPAIELTVRKEGPNKGRQFYKCSNSGGCSFFLWKDLNGQSNNFNPPSNDQNNSLTLNRNNNNRQNSNPNQGYQHHSNQNQWNQPSSSTANNQSDFQGPNNVVLCQCNLPARKLTVQKNNANKGRQFYGCSKDFNSGCGFFKWADEMSGSNMPSSSGRGRGGYNQSGRSNDSNQRRPRETRAKRKCGNCGIEGHTKKTCQQNSSMD